MKRVDHAASAEVGTCAARSGPQAQMSSSSCRTRRGVQRSASTSPSLSTATSASAQRTSASSKSQQNRSASAASRIRSCSRADSAGASTPRSVRITRRYATVRVLVMTLSIARRGANAIASGWLLAAIEMEASTNGLVALLGSLEMADVSSARNRDELRLPDGVHQLACNDGRRRLRLRSMSATP
jgi:hypothetical protein